MSIGRKARKVLAFFLVLAVWGVAMPIMIDLMTSLVNWLSANNFTKIDVPYRYFNGTAWVDRTVTIDIAGVLNIILMLAIFGAPIIAFLKLW